MSDMPPGGYHRPPDYEAIQCQWSQCRSEGIEKGARERVQQCVAQVVSHGLTIENETILVIGPQHGFELLEFDRVPEVAEVIGVDPCEEFVEDCTKLGFMCAHGDAENIVDFLWAEHEFGVYASHSLEHCWNLPRAVEGIKRLAREWAFIVVPIEAEGESKDEAHFSQVRSVEDFEQLFAPELVPVWRHPFKERPGKKGDYRALFVRQ